MEIKKVTVDEENENNESIGISGSCFPVCNPEHCFPEGACSPSKP